MRVFVTGATGLIGTHVVRELLAAGHSVLGLARSDRAAQALAAAGAEAHRGSLEDPGSFERGAAAAGAAIHLAFNHDDFTKWVENSAADRRAIEALGAGLAGSGGRLIVTSGTAVAVTPGRPSTEDDAANSPIPRVASEHAADAVAARGVQVSVIRLPQVHDPLKQGLISYLVEAARRTGVSAYVGDGENRWPAVHVLDAARLYRLALENGVAGARYNAVGEEGVPMRDVAGAVGRALKLPVVSKTPDEASEHFGWLGPFAGADMPASSALTQARLKWRPEGPGLMEDLSHARFAAA